MAKYIHTRYMIVLYLPVCVPVSLCRVSNYYLSIIVLWAATNFFVRNLLQLQYFAIVNINTVYIVHHAINTTLLLLPVRINIL